MKSANHQFVDIEVTKFKYSEELHKFNTSKDYYRQQGVILLDESFPNLYFGFAAPMLIPIPLLFAVKINFDNYDVMPLSVKFVHPLTFKSLKKSEMQTLLPRKLEGSQQVQLLLQADNDDHPFFCIPGVREYHEHPYHTGDSWFLYRKKAHEGSLCFILDNLQLYGTSHIKAYNQQIIITAQNSNINVISENNNIPF